MIRGVLIGLVCLVVFLGALVLVGTLTPMP